MWCIFLNDEKICGVCFKRASKNFYIRSGNLYLEGNLIILKYIFKTIAVFHKDDLNCKLLPDDIMGNKILTIGTGDEKFELLFSKAAFKKFNDTLNDLQVNL